MRYASVKGSSLPRLLSMQRCSHKPPRCEHNHCGRQCNRRPMAEK